MKIIKLSSAFATGGLSEDILTEVLTSHELIVSLPLLDKLERVLREKLGLPTALVPEIVRFLEQETTYAQLEDYHRSK
ncbi:MAG: hypothetical protein ACE5JU_22005 [Candidatus Binatia bacterium]